jgi:hypothetical protein
MKFALSIGPRFIGIFSPPEGSFRNEFTTSNDHIAWHCIGCGELIAKRVTVEASPLHEPARWQHAIGTCLVCAGRGAAPQRLVQHFRSRAEQAVGWAPLTLVAEEWIYNLQLFKDSEDYNEYGSYWYLYAC